MTKEEIIMELIHISHGISEGMITEETVIKIIDNILERVYLTKNVINEETQKWHIYHSSI